MESVARLRQKGRVSSEENKPAAASAEEVVVVGASAAGLYAAKLIARAGRRIRVVEASPGLQPTPRTLIVTQQLRSLVGSAAEAGVVNEIRRFELFTDGRSAQVALGQPDLVIERSRLIRALADEAQLAGAMLACNTRFLSLAPNSSRPRCNGSELRLEVESGGRREELHAANVVGADGVSSRVARTAGWPPLETVPLVQAIVRLPKDCPTDTVRVWFVPDDTPYFYWLIPESEERAALGLIAEDGRDATRRLARFLEKRRMEPIAWQGARIPAYRRWIPVRRRVGRGDVYLVGDAAAQVKVTTIGGVITGFRGARGVAEAILNGGRSAELRALRRELGTHWLIRRALHHFQQVDYSRLVDLLDASARESLGEITRDDAVRLLWSVARRQPRLLLLGLRGLLLGHRELRP